jgi:plastocyanin
MLSIQKICAAALVGASVVAAGCGSSSSSSSSSSTAAASTPAASAAAPAASGAAAVTYQNFAASPNTITVKVGQKITWTNKDSVAHNVTSTSGPAGDKIASPAINGGSTFSFTPKTAGTIAYVCTFHPQMTGFKIIVKA